MLPQNTFYSSDDQIVINKAVQYGVGVCWCFISRGELGMRMHDSNENSFMYDYTNHIYSSFRGHKDCLGSR